MLDKLTAGYLYIISFIAFLVKRLPKLFEMDRNPGLVGRIYDAHRSATWTYREVMQKTWMRFPGALPYALMLCVYAIWTALAFIFFFGGHGSMLALTILGVIDHPNAIALMVSKISVFAMCASLIISVTIGFPPLRMYDWLKKEGLLEKTDWDPEEEDATFEPPGKFRPRFLSSMAIIVVAGGACSWLFWLLESELMLSKGMLWI